MRRYVVHLQTAAGPLEAALITAAFHDGRPRTISDLILAVYPAKCVDPQLLDVIDAYVTAAVHAMIAAGHLVEVVVDEPDGSGGDVWVGLPSTSKACPC
ncbi:hypothetical protein [Nonomuraea sp. NPDC049784]|uniref:hypothetical protein n=1 Tax=Nonomuraea sp. NPDC049784 TaxID=3154361 RepID=UPI0033F0DCD5